MTMLRLTPALRLIEPEPIAGMLGAHPKLQQAWECTETGEVEWRDVPVIAWDEDAKEPA